MEDLYILDATGYLFRSFHAIPHMNNQDGQATNGLFGFVRSVFKLQSDFKPKNIVAVFDGPQNAESRRLLFKDYKANRVAPPDELPHQLGWARDFCDLAGIPVLMIPKVEADDTMGTIAKWASSEGAYVYICSSDKDLFQLVNDKISILQTYKDNLLVDSKKTEDMFGVPPEKIVDYLALTGDTSDNVPGLPGFGPKTAASLLGEFGTLEYILDHPEEVPGKKKQETIREQRGMAELSKQLVTIDTHIDIPRDENFYMLKERRIAELIEFLQHKNFGSILKDLGAQPSTSAKKVERVDYHLVNDLAKFEELLKLLQSNSEICVDTETTSIRPMEAEIVGIGFSVKESEGWYVPFNGALDRTEIITRLKPLFADRKKSFFGHNFKYDLHLLKNHGIDVAHVGFDTILSSYILHAHERRHSLDLLSLQIFGKTKIPIENLIGKGKSEINMRDVPIEQVCEYCCEDVDYTFRLKNHFEKELKERKLLDILIKLEVPLTIVLFEMERAGIYLDQNKLKELSVLFASELERLEKKIYAEAGEEFNIKSPKQLSEILFEKMGIKPPKKTATGFSTNAEVLEGMSKEHPICEYVLEYRTVEKLRSTYADTLPLEVNPKTGRVHCTFNQYIAATGRLSCTDPNLQNIPVRTELGKQIREAFRPERKGWSFLGADYSQIELRLLAHFSQDPNLVEAFKQGADIHRWTAAKIAHVSLKEVTDEMRHKAKAINFGIIYGQQAFGLSRELGIPMKEAADFIEKYFEKYPGVKGFIESCKEKARQSGKSVTLIGREREIVDIHNANPMLRSAAERLAVNTPLQGTAADLIKMAMLKVQEEIERRGLLSRMILQIHDELIFEVPDYELTEMEILVRERMEKVYSLRVPLIVDISIGKNWREC